MEKLDVTTAVASFWTLLPLAGKMAPRHSLVVGTVSQGREIVILGGESSGNRLQEILLFDCRTDTVEVIGES